jgi:hypothetical protein
MKQAQAQEAKAMQMAEMAMQNPELAKEAAENPEVADAAMRGELE